MTKTSCRHCIAILTRVSLKGGYLDFPHLTVCVCVCVCACARVRACVRVYVRACARVRVCVTEIYMKKQRKSSITKNHKITRTDFFHGVPSKRYVASSVIFRFCARNKEKKKEKNIVEISNP